MFDFNEKNGDDEEWGLWDGQCQACDGYGRVNDLGLCETCADKLDRDLIRQRAWEHSVEAWALPDEARETLRRRVIAEYGEELELIVEEEEEEEDRRSTRRRRKRRRPRRR